MEHSEIYILKLIEILISRRLIDQYNWNSVSSVISKYRIRGIKMIEFWLLIWKLSTAVVACALVTQRAQVRFPVGTGFLGEVFRGFSAPVRRQETLGPQGPRISFGRRNHHSIFALLVWLSVCLVCIVFHVYAVSDVAPALGWSLIRGGPPCPCVVKKSMYVIHSLIPSTDRSWLCKARAAWVT